MSRILIIDDDASIRAIVAETLLDEGYSVQTAANGAEGLELMAINPPALILLDMRMPVLDGWAFAKRLRERGIAVPLVVMTAAQDARRWAHEIGARAAIAKPFDLNDLVDTIARTIPPERNAEQ